MHMQESCWPHLRLIAFRFHEILKTLANSDEGKLHLLKVLYEVWRNHPQVQQTDPRACK